MSIFLVLAVGLLALGARGVSALVARLTLPTGGAQWIWVEREWTDRSPAAFYAVRDFFLDAIPARARLLALADPEYVLTLNGRRIGAGQYQPTGTAKLDVYEVGDLLQAGGNRIVVELRSDRGAVFIHCPVLRRYPPQPVLACDAYRPAAEAPPR